MSFQNNVFQPGAILHEVIAGAMRSRGTTLHEWCKDKGVAWSTVRQVTFGMSAGPRSQGLLDHLIEDAGREVVTAAYRVRMDAEAQKLAQTTKVAA
ncbi:hypothetical protein SAMN05421641_1057 [Paracoccus thiocyanatus]|uniref:Uncharacterized protein n=1 Tax=Paracoccus thiocyanatus TaxID=34006 RepID=A0A1N6R083_9RHOB|nr:hypothetical protein [Paracoccus thiocyanatus]SIQ22248.1 hypothetical protein SAMN05421641_1057 [Paracoccus thiocyanatus]